MDPPKTRSNHLIWLHKDDKWGRKLKEFDDKLGVHTLCNFNDGDEPTGVCAVLITGQHRSLVTRLGAAEHFKEKHVDCPENWKYVEKAKFYYISAFFLTVSPPSVMKIAEHALANNKTVIMNLNAKFICKTYKEPMMHLMPYVDVVIGNLTECIAFAEANSIWTKTIHEVAAKIAELPKKSSRPRIVIITQSSNHVVVVEHGKEAVEYPVDTLAPEAIVDTNGAGDAFAGGFLAQFVEGKPLAECIYDVVSGRDERLSHSPDAPSQRSLIMRKFDLRLDLDLPLA